MFENERHMIPNVSLYVVYTNFSPLVYKYLKCTQLYVYNVARFYIVV